MTDDERRIIKAALFVVYHDDANAYMVDGEIIKRDDIMDGLINILSEEG